MQIVSGIAAASAVAFIAAIVIAIVLLLWFRGKRRNHVSISDTEVIFVYLLAFVHALCCGQDPYPHPALSVSIRLLAHFQAVKYSVTQQPETNREGSPTTSEYSPSVEAKQVTMCIFLIFDVVQFSGPHCGRAILCC